MYDEDDEHYQEMKDYYAELKWEAERDWELIEQIEAQSKRTLPPATTNGGLESSV